MYDFISVFVLVLLLALLTTIVVRTLRYNPLPGANANPDVADLAPGELTPAELERLSGALAIPTVSSQNYADTDFAPFREFIAYLERSFLLFHQHTERHLVNGYALIYRWPGRDPNRAPIAFLAHYDVVPVEADSATSWIHPPFAGTVADGYIWGRGSLDIKSQLIGYLEAAEALLRQGFTPATDIYFCFGHDEEVGGAQGAVRIVSYLKEQGIRFGAVLDEGGEVLAEPPLAAKAPLALIGIAEKGQCNYHLTVEGVGGHSSMPPKHSSLGLAAQLISRIENNPLPARLIEPVKLMLDKVYGQLGLLDRIGLANLWLLKPLLLKRLAANPVTSPLIRSTCAVTMAQASKLPNVLPKTSNFTVNVRLLPGDSVTSVLDYLKRLSSDHKVQIETLLAHEASPISTLDNDFYRLLQKLIARFYPAAITTPYLVMGGTDSRHYYALSDSVYRFTPIHISSTEQELIHNTNERLSTENYARMLKFYKSLLAVL